MRPIDFSPRTAARDVVYLLGTADNDPSIRPSTSAAPAEAQGRTRIERGHAYVRYERALAGKTIRLAHHAYDVTGIGHDQAGMFGSLCGRRAIFGTDRVGREHCGVCRDHERKELTWSSNTTSHAQSTVRGLPSRHARRWEHVSGQAATYPDHPIRFIVPSAPGGGPEQWRD
jgi:hypothetical protein